jgi:hypothetical protein
VLADFKSLKGINMMNRKKFAGIALMAISGITLSVNTVLSTASATEVATSTEVVTEELCTWYLLGAPSSIDLEPATADTEYEGDLILVSDSFTESEEDELNVYSSGNVSAGGRTTYGNCTFYSAVTRPIVTMAITDDDFTASANVAGTPTVDGTMDFKAETGNEFIVDQTGTCTAAWTKADLSLKTAALTGVVMTIPTLADVEDRVTSSNDRCMADLLIKINIPAGKTPTYPGRTYTWSGPGFTTALTTSGS